MSYHLSNLTLKVWRQSGPDNSDHFESYKIDSISDEKTTGLGTGHFVTTRQDYYDAKGELVDSMMFRIFRFRPKAKTPTAKPKPPRPRPSTTHDNQWWFDALKEGRVQAQRCAACSELRFPTGPMCASCHSLS